MAVGESNSVAGTPGSLPGGSSKSLRELIRLDQNGNVQTANEFSFTDTNAVPLTNVTGITGSASTTTTMNGIVVATRQVLTITTSGAPTTGTVTIGTLNGTTQPTTTLDTTATFTTTNVLTTTPFATRAPTVSIGMSGVGGGTFNITSWSVSRQDLWGRP